MSSIETLKLYSPTQAECSETPPEKARIRALPEPMPILYRMIGHEVAGQPHVDIVRVWANEEGERCRVCPHAECTFVPDPSGIGSCVTRKKGKLAESPGLLETTLG